MKRITAPLAALALALTLTACSDNEEPAKSDNQKTAEQVYDETQPKVESHIKTFGISETADLCKTAQTPGDEYDTLVEQIMADAGVKVQGTTREDPDYMGAYDATADTIHDTCENYNK